jgi:hypothetical protein
MHDKRELLFEKLKGAEVDNLAKKQEIIAKIEILATEKVNEHTQWLVQIEKVEALKINAEQSFDNATIDFQAILADLEKIYPTGEIDLNEGVVIYESAE